MNKLILEILPLIQKSAKKLTANTDTQNELTQYTVVELYKYETKLTSDPHVKIGALIHTIMRNEYVRLKNRHIIDEKQDQEYIEHVELLEEFKKHLTYHDNLWIRAYCECEGSYSEIERIKGVTRKMASARIKLIIEKCKQLKHLI